MTSHKAPGRFRTATLLLLALTLPASGADLASTYAHDAFPPAAPPADPARQPCRQARLARTSRRARKPAAGAVRHGSGSPQFAPAERVGRPGVVTNEDDPTHS